MVQSNVQSPNGSTVSLLAHYTDRAKTVDAYVLRYAVKDILATLKLHNDKPTTDPYVAKLLAEFDAYTVELYNRDNPKNSRKG